MVVNGNRESKLCLVLTDYVFVKLFLYLFGARERFKGQFLKIRAFLFNAELLVDKLSAKIYAVITYITLTVTRGDKERTPQSLKCVCTSRGL